MTEAIGFACRRFATTLAMMFSVIGAGVSVVLIAPVIEVKINPPVQKWEIVEAERRGDMLSWRVAVDRRRDCTPEIRWFARWGGQTANLNVVGISAGGNATIGPFSALIPRGWQNSDDIRIDAVVTYGCGMPWRLPPMDVREAQVVDRG